MNQINLIAPKTGGVFGIAQNIRDNMVNKDGKYFIITRLMLRKELMEKEGIDWDDFINGKEEFEMIKCTGCVVEAVGLINDKCSDDGNIAIAEDVMVRFKESELIK